VLYERGELAEAAQLGTQALDLRERAYGHMHGSVASSLIAPNHGPGAT
jgi:hypothetical protein